MITVRVKLPAFPGHRIKRRGNKYHAIPVETSQPHRCSRLCSCNPVAHGPTDVWGHGLFIHQP